MLLVSMSAVVTTLINYVSAIEQPARVVTNRIPEELKPCFEMRNTPGHGPQSLSP